MDLETVSVIENFVLCATVQQVRESGMDRDSLLRIYDISEEEYERAENSYEKYERIGTMKIYDYIYKRETGRLPEKALHYVAGTLEIRPSKARKSLRAMKLIEKGRCKEENSSRREFLEKYSIVSYTTSQLMIDRIMRDTERTPEEKIKRICELELLEDIKKLDIVDEANRKQNTDRYRIAREDEGREIG